MSEDSDTILFAGVDGRTGSPYKPEELKKRDAKRQLPADRLYSAVKHEAFQRTVGAMGHFNFEQQIEALTLLDWNLDALTPLVKQKKNEETEKQEKVEDQNRLKAAETQATLNTPLNLFAKAFKYRITLPSFRLKLQTWIEQQTRDTLQSVYEDLSKGKLPTAVVFTTEDVDAAITYLGVAINQKKTSEPEKKPLLQRLHL
jgi:hypothetical protein